MSICDMKGQIREKYQKLSSLLKPVYNHATEQKMKPPFFCAVDESQAVVLLLQWEYRTDDFRWSRPLPKELVRSWTTLLPSEHMHLVLSGTGIDLHLFEESLNTPAFKECKFDLKSDLGAFEDAETQSEYIKRYVPADWSKPAWKALLHRAWIWLRGRLLYDFYVASSMLTMRLRYRSTATLVTLLLEVGYLSPHRTLNRYVEAFTNFRPSDGAQWVVDEPELPLDKDFRTRVTSLNLDKLQEKGRLNGRTFMQTNKSIRENTCYNTLPSHL